MDTLQATPSNDTLMAIAAALRKARSFWILNNTTTSFKP
jgi:hypothetical protein